MAKRKAEAKPSEYKYFAHDLKKSWDEYGHAIDWDDLFAFRERSDGCYVVLAWKEGDDIYVADLAHTNVKGEPWEMQNDGSDPLTQEQWDNLFIVRECDWWRIKGEDDGF